MLIIRLPDGKEIAARLERAFSARIGSRLRLYANMNLMHLFEKDSGQVIPVPRR
jgi:hypothetical protein